MLDGLRRDEDPGFLHPERLAASNAITPPRRHALWRDPREVGEAAALAIAMFAGAGGVGALIAGALMNEAVLVFLGIIP